MFQNTTFKSEIEKKIMGDKSEKTPLLSSNSKSINSHESSYNDTHKPVSLENTGSQKELHVMTPTPKSQTPAPSPTNPNSFHICKVGENVDLTKSQFHISGVDCNTCAAEIEKTLEVCVIYGYIFERMKSFERIDFVFYEIFFDRNFSSLFFFS